MQRQIKSHMHCGGPLGPKNMQALTIKCDPPNRRRLRKDFANRKLRIKIEYVACNLDLAKLLSFASRATTDLELPVPENALGKAVSAPASCAATALT